MPGASRVAAVVTTIAGPLVLARVEPVVLVAILVGVVVTVVLVLIFRRPRPSGSGPSAPVITTKQPRH